MCDRPTLASATTDPARLSAQLGAAVSRGASCAVRASGAAAVAKTIAAIQLLRRELLRSGYELGVAPMLEAGRGRDGEEVRGRGPGGGGEYDSGGKGGGDEKAGENAQP